MTARILALTVTSLLSLGLSAPSYAELVPIKCKGAKEFGKEIDRACKAMPRPPQKVILGDRDKDGFYDCQLNGCEIELEMPCGQNGKDKAQKACDVPLIFPSLPNKPTVK